MISISAQSPAEGSSSSCGVMGASPLGALTCPHISKRQQLDQLLQQEGVERTQPQVTSLPLSLDLPEPDLFLCKWRPR